MKRKSYLPLIGGRITGILPTRSSSPFDLTLDPGGGPNFNDFTPRGFPNLLTEQHSGIVSDTNPHQNAL